LRDSKDRIVLKSVQQANLDKPELAVPRAVAGELRRRRNVVVSDCGRVATETVDVTVWITPTASAAEKDTEGSSSTSPPLMTTVMDHPEPSTAAPSSTHPAETKIVVTAPASDKTETKTRSSNSSLTRTSFIDGVTTITLLPGTLGASSETPCSETDITTTTTTTTSTSSEPYHVAKYGMDTTITVVRQYTTDVPCEEDSTTVTGAAETLSAESSAAMSRL
jgi:hypothetical protein